MTATPTDENQEAPVIPPGTPANTPAPEPEVSGNPRRGERGKSRAEGRSHKGMTVEFRVYPEEADALRERATECNLSVSEFCRRAVSGKRIVSRFDYDVVRRLAELHGDQTRLGNLLKAEAFREEGIDTESINSLALKLTVIQAELTELIREVASR